MTSIRITSLNEVDQVYKVRGLRNLKYGNL